jgi:uncharacterized protein YjbJ (UPF0337 family)
MVRPPNQELPIMDENRFEGTAKQVGGKVQGAYGDAVGSDKHSAEGRLRDGEGAAQDLYGQGLDAARAAAAEARRYATDLYANAGSYARDGSEIARRQVHDHPLSSLLIAGFIGFMLGMNLRDRR